ncbi:MAG: pyrroline-5-carboxylate reductase dimerization domain-containing protein [Pseudomonadota bacterium]
MAERLLIIGYGNMSGAMLAGWLAAGEDPARFSILNRSPKPVPEGVRAFTDLAEAQAESTHDAVLLGFKPQQLDELAPVFIRLAGEGVAVHSLLAGLSLDQLRKAFPSAKAHVRVMPNLASRINKSPVILAHDGLSEGDQAAVGALYEELGTAVWLEDESNYDLLTALAGSGPGFVYRFIDALAIAAERLGAAPEHAQSLAKAMVDGASSLAAASDISPGELANRVASPKGMTREGLDVLDSNEALVALLTATLDATAKRGAELSAGK